MSISDFQARKLGIVRRRFAPVPQRNLELQTQLIARTRGFIGTYGGFSIWRLSTECHRSRISPGRNGFESHHLDLANRVFDRVLRAVSLPWIAPAHLVEPAIGKGFGVIVEDAHLGRTRSTNAPDPITKR